MDKFEGQKFSSIWFKFDDYEIVQVDKKTYVKPKETSKIDIYNPFDKANEILVDVLKIGRLIEQNDIKSSNKAILEFVNNYGLLGEMTYIPLNRNILEQGKVFLPKGNLVSDKEVLDTDEYIREFLKCDTNNVVSIGKGINGSMSVAVGGEVTPFIAIDMPIEFAVVFSKSYSECLVWIMHYAHKMYRTFEAIENFHKENDDDYARQLKTILIRDFSPSNLTCKVLVRKEPASNPVLEWNFNSLKQAIDVIFALNATSGRKTVKACKYCGLPFYSENLKAEYCSPQCRNKANVYKSRAKNS